MSKRRQRRQERRVARASKRSARRTQNSTPSVPVTPMSNAMERYVQLRQQMQQGSKQTPVTVVNNPPPVQNAPATTVPLQEVIAPVQTPPPVEESGGEYEDEIGFLYVI